jgi:putative ABC transport system substrate-binding protein
MIGRRLAALVMVALGILAPWPSGWAQPAGKVVRIGYLGTSTPELERHLVEAFRRRLFDLGYTDDRKLTIVSRWAEGHDDRLAALAAELVGLSPDVIVVTGTPGILAARQATSTIPIVMTSSGDPVGSGLVASLARPGGNITGVTIFGPELEGKRLELLKQMASRVARIGVFWNSANPAALGFYQQAQAAAAALGLTLHPVAEIRGVGDFERAFATITEARPDGLMVIADRFLAAHRARIVEFAMARRLPSVFPYKEYVDAGGLMSYAPSNTELFRDAAVYVDKILKGAKAGNLPVQLPTKFELVLNLKVAKALGLRIPNSLLMRADHVIE